MSRLKVIDKATKIAPCHSPEARRKAHQTLSRHIANLGSTARALWFSRLHSKEARHKALESRKRFYKTRRASLVTAEMRAAYTAGESLKSLSDRTGITRSILAAAIREAGGRIRGQREAELLKWSGRNRVEIERQCRAAWKASRGRERSQSEKELAARTNYERQTRIGKCERALATCLRENGLPIIQQFPFRQYNLDLAIETDRIAVEVFAVHPDTSALIRARHTKRTKSLLSAGWTVVEVHAWRRDGLAINSRDERGHLQKRSLAMFAPRIVAEYLVTLIKELRRNPSAPRQYRVIDGQGQPTSVKGLQYDDRS